MAEHPIRAWIRAHVHTAIRPLDQVEKEAILQAMILCRGNVSLAAERLGIARETLSRKLSKYRDDDVATL
jgi:transcriptional regulator of acetoin/glycerol metabolism